MNKYGPKAQRVIARTMHEFSEGTLRSGKSGTPVRSRKQALAIGISKARQQHYKVPKEQH